MFASFLVGAYFSQTERSAFHATSVTSQLSGTKGLETAYLKWAAQHEQMGGDYNVTMPLGWSKAYSREFSRARGWAKLDLIKGSVTVEVQGLEDSDIRDVWLVDNQPAPGHSAMPEPGDDMLRVGALKSSADKATLHADAAPTDTPTWLHQVR